MQSVLRSRRPSPRAGDERSRPIKPIKRRRKSPTVSPAAIAVSLLGLWLIGGVAWWQYQQWQPTGESKVDSQQVPIHRTASQSESTLH